MKQFLYIASLAILLSSCAGGQLFVEARTTYNVPLNDNGILDTNTLETQYNNHSGLQNLHPQIRLTYRQYIFDKKRYPKAKPYKLKK
tara:strand:- start:1708 stop:1968 length:261 start_codon:yes stop_codon:yes gene_type:complete